MVLVTPHGLFGARDLPTVNTSASMFVRLRGSAAMKVASWAQKLIRTRRRALPAARVNSVYSFDSSKDIETLRKTLEVLRSAETAR